MVSLGSVGRLQSWFRWGQVYCALMLVEPAMPYPIYMFHREAYVSLASLRLVAMSGHPRVSAQSLADFVAQLAGRPCCALTTLYGFVLTDDNGRRAVYVGADASGCRPGAYLDALCVDLAAASPDVAALPGRLRFLAARGFRFRSTPVWELRGVPPGAETAAALALEGEFGQGLQRGWHPCAPPRHRRGARCSSALALPRRAPLRGVRQARPCSVVCHLRRDRPQHG